MLERNATDYYRATAGPGLEAAPLRGATEARVCIIGGGYAGLNTALGLVERGVTDVVVLEAKAVGYGASGRNGKTVSLRALTIRCRSIIGA